MFWRCFGRLVLNHILLVVVAILFGCLHHVHIVCGGGRPSSGKLRVLALFVSSVVVHTVDVFGGIVQHVGWILDSGYEVGGGWDVKFPALRP